MQNCSIFLRILISIYTIYHQPTNVNLVFKLLSRSYKNNLNFSGGTTMESFLFTIFPEEPVIQHTFFEKSIKILFLNKIEKLLNLL